MKRLYVILLSLILLTPSFAQEINELRIVGKSNKLQSSDLIGRKDQNGKLCAGIQVISDMDGFSYDSNDGIVGDILDNPGSDIVFLTPTERVLDIFNTGFKPLKIILSDIGITLKSGEMWQIEIAGDQKDNLLPVTIFITPEDAVFTIDSDTVENTGTHSLSVGSHMISITRDGFQTVQDTVTINEKKVFFSWNLEKLQSQWLVITSQPEGADVYLDDKPVGKTPYQNEIQVGEYEWRLSKELYLSDSGIVDLSTSKKSVLDIKLKQNYGTLDLTSTPANSSVSINGIDVNKITPCVIEKVPAGECAITLNLNKYGSTTQTINLNPGEIKKMDITLTPNFGTINLTSSPENGASVSLNGINAGKVTPCCIEVPAGESNITLTMDMYETKTQKTAVKAGEIIEVILPLNPTFAVVNVTSDPACDIYINGTLKGSGNWQGRLNPGVYTFEGKLDKFVTTPVKQAVKIGEPVGIKLNPKPITGSLKIITNPIDAAIKLNGNTHGSTPSTISGLLIGEYNLSLEKAGYGIVNKKIVIQENKITEINETLITGLEVTFSSDPFGAALTIDGKSKGKTPCTVFLTFGTYSVELQKMEYEDYSRKIEITNGKNSFDFELKPIGKDVYFKSSPAGARIIIDGIERGNTPGNVFIKPGNHNFSIEKSGFRTRKGSIDGDNNRRKRFVNLKPSTVVGLGVIDGPGSTGGELFIWGKGGLVLSYMDIDPLETLSFQDYTSYGMAIQTGVRFIYPIDFMIHGGYGWRSFTNKDDNTDVETFNSLVLGATLPLRLSKKFGFYGKVDYWFNTEKYPIILYSAGFIF